MTEHQLSGATGAFTHWLGELAALLDQGGGWYGVFLRRDPEGIGACLEGAELPPWDVVEALLQDFAALRGEETARAQTARARQLHAAAAAACDRRPGGRAALHARLELMLREQARAAERGRELVTLLSGTVEGSARAERLAHDLAWLRDDHGRATARVAELRARLAALPPEPPPADWESGPVPGLRRPWPGSALEPGQERQPGSRRRPVRDAEPPPERGGLEPERPSAPEAGAQAAVGSGKRSRTGDAARRRPRGARYAWLDDVDEDSGPVAAPLEAGSDAGGAAPAPTGARFGGGAESAAPHPVLGEALGAEAPEPDTDAHPAVAHAVSDLLALRAEGRSGEAHVLLCEAAQWPAARLPLLADALHRAGLAADWATLLWEAASLPTERLADLAGALAGAGREQDARQLLRHGVARPGEDVAAAVSALEATGWRARARALVEVFVEVRSPEDTARFAACAPHRLVPEVLAAVRAVAPAREPALVHALRVAGLVAT